MTSKTSVKRPSFSPITANKPLKRPSSKPEVPFKDLIFSYQKTRKRMLDLCDPLEIEDYVVQTASYMSPPRWHMGHTTWFFEMVLKKFKPKL